MTLIARTRRSISGASFVPSPVGPPTIGFDGLARLCRRREPGVAAAFTQAVMRVSDIQGQVDRPIRMALRTRWARRHRQAQLATNGRASMSATGRRRGKPTPRRAGACSDAC
jgi:hypothetical protein